MRTRNWLPLSMIGAALCGCAPVDETRQDVHQADLIAARQGCLAGGLAPDTPEFTECERQKLEFATDLQYRSLEATQGLASPNRRIAPGAGQLCVPTASGLAVGNCSQPPLYR